MIDYLPDKLRESYIDHLYKNKFFLFNALKDLNMRRFIASKMRLSEKCFRDRLKMQQSLERAYDVVICGSDEIWNLDSPYIGFDPAYFLNFIEHGTAHKLSYAASFGSMRSLGNRKDKVRELLLSFDGISVRDQASLSFVRDECGLSATKTVDPTLLTTYDDITIAPEIERPYALVYGGLSQQEQIFVKQFAHRRGLDLIAVGYPCKVANKNYLSVGPGEWLGYFSRASYVFTNFYHGVLFSVIFDRPFNCFYRDEKSQKVCDFLSDIGLTDRIIKDVDWVDQSQLEPELSFDRPKLQSLIHESKAFIQRHLKSTALI